MRRREFLALAPTALAAAPPPHIAFVTGDDEYRSEYSMPALAKIFEKRHGLRTSVAYARPTPQSNANIEGLESLATADLAVFFLRWRALPDEQMKRILAFAGARKPMAGFRTTTHSFRYPKGSPHENWNDGFGRDIFGQKWFRHHGAASSTRVTAVASHPILNGVEKEFTARSWLYEVEPLVGDCTRLLSGTAINPQGKDASPQPVAWVKTYNGARVFFTTLGHPKDFEVDSMRQLAVNGILWALGRKIPRKGADARWVEPYAPPESGVPKKP
jgi:type 1 glutamine amidotransferase